MLYKYLVLGLYFALLILIGYIASKRVKNISDYYAGGKTMGFWGVAFSSRATGESAWLLLGLTGLAATIGVKAFWAVVGEIIGVTICWLFMAKPFKRLTDKYDSLTIPDYLSSRFSSSGSMIRIISVVVLVVFFTIYISAQIDATGSAFETFFNLNYYTGAILGFVVVMAYISFGGFLAVVWSDIFQGSMMFLTLLALPIIGILSLPSLGISSGLFSTLSTINTGLLSVWGVGGFTLINFFEVLGLASIGIGFLGAPQVFVRFIAVKNTSEISKGTIVAIIFTIVTDSAAVLIGLIGRALFTEPGQDVVSILGNGGQNVYPILVETLLPAVIVGIYIAAILAAIMSTVDSLIVVVSSAITRDFYQIFLNPNATQKQLSKMSYKVTIIISLLALAISIGVSILSPTRTVFWFIVFGWSGVACSFCPMMILSLSWKRYNAKGAMASMITGFLSVPFFKFVAVMLPVVGIYFTAVSEMLPSFIVSFCFGVVVTLQSSSKKTAPHTTINAIDESHIIHKPVSKQKRRVLL
ncbi:sodium:proline symporter [Candidatus Marinamargulisbacteria bacterium SCGC AAA071-K20]|nr:sodium:proline symporter [Candidatus Marinamargulisbacteria bacterium SCGC AAA071-K20]